VVAAAGTAVRVCAKPAHSKELHSCKTISKTFSVLKRHQLPRDLHQSEIQRTQIKEERERRRGRSDETHGFFGRQSKRFYEFENWMSVLF
jgi:hypothetical protein